MWNRFRLWVISFLGGAVPSRPEDEQPKGALLIRHTPGCGFDFTNRCLAFVGPQGVQVLTPMTCPKCGLAIYTASPVLRPTPDGPKVGAAGGRP